jgi:uncharacterized membrane protein
MIKTTIFGGVLFLLPLVVVALVVGKGFQLSMLLAKPLDTILPIENVAGVALVNVLAVVVMLAICYAAGLAARREVIRDKVKRLDAALVEIVPIYAFAKTMVSSIVHAEDEAGTLTPVMVHFDDYSQIALEVERNDDAVVIFLPGSPGPWSGSTVIVDSKRVSKLSMSSHEAVKLIRVLGRGSVGLEKSIAKSSS